MKIEDLQQKESDKKYYILYINDSVYRQSEKVRKFAEDCDKYGIYVKLYSNKAKELLKSVNMDLSDFILWERENDSLM